MRGIDGYIMRRFKMREGLSYPYIGGRGGRFRLAEVFNEIGYKCGVEIGTREGNFSKILCEQIPGVRLTCVDPWIAFNQVSQEKQDMFRKTAETTLAPFNVNIMVMKSMEAVNTFDDGSLDFVFIDGSHDFDDVMCDLIFWSKKVKIGGIVAAHDYSMFPDVVRAVNAYVNSHKIEPWYLLREYESTVCWVKKR